MRSWSIPLGRWFGVEIRMHTFFVLLLALSVSWASMSNHNGMRGVALWLILVFAVVVREIARLLACSWFNLELRSIQLLPTGGLIQFATADSMERANEGAIQRKIAIVGPITSFLFGAVIGLLIFAATPDVDMLSRPWITPFHLLRAAFWIQLLLGAINLLPAWPLDAGRVLRGEFSRSRGLAGGTRAAVGFGQMIALVMIIAGIVTFNMWLLLIGAFVLIGAQMEDHGLMLQSSVDTVVMRDVMLTEFATLSASDTLEDALEKSIHSMQDVFPVTRGNNLVGVISRQSILEALQSEGNGYVQAIMSRAFHTAQSGDSLVQTLRRMMGPRAQAQLVPVLDGERIVGIITPQNLNQSMSLLALKRRMRNFEEQQP